MFFFSSRRRHTRCGRDWSSNVCSSDLINGIEVANEVPGVIQSISFESGDTVKQGDVLIRLDAAIEEARSEERRVGKECRSPWRPYHRRKKSSVSVKTRSTGWRRIHVA